MNCKISLIVFLSAILSLSGCGMLSEDLPTFGEELQEESLTTNPELLYGTWELARTNSFTASGHSHTRMADAAEEIHRVEIDADSVYRYLDNDRVWTSAYRLVNLSEVPGTIQLESHSPNPHFGVNEEKLVLSTAYIDGPEEVFGRMD